MAAKSPQYIADLIDRLETKIEAELATPEYLNGLQRRLNTLLSTAAMRGSTAQDHRYQQYASELQALIFGTQGHDEQALQCVDDAVAQAGSVRKLRSRLLKTYVRKNSLVAAQRSAVRAGPGDLSLLSEKERRFLRSYHLDGTPEIDFLVRRPGVFIAMGLLSSGIYYLYWFYKNWQAVQHASERKLSPLWRTVYSIFYTWSLFKIMALIAKSRGFKRGYSSTWLTAGYFFTGIIFLPPYFLSTSKLAIRLLGILTLCISSIFLILAQQAAAFAVAKQTGPRAESRPINYVEYLFVAVGLLVFVSTTIAAFRAPDPYAGYSLWQRFHIVSAKQQLTITTENYQQCTADLAAARPKSGTADKAAQCKAMGQARDRASQRYDALMRRK